MSNPSLVNVTILYQLMLVSRLFRENILRSTFRDLGYKGLKEKLAKRFNLQSCVVFCNVFEKDPDIAISNIEECEHVRVIS